MKCSWALKPGETPVQGLARVNRIPPSAIAEVRDFVASCPRCGREVTFYSAWVMKGSLLERLPFVVHA